MTAEASKAALSREQIRQALAVLREEQRAHPIFLPKEDFSCATGSRSGFFSLVCSFSLVVWCTSLHGCSRRLVFLWCLLVASFFAIILLLSFEHAS